MIYIETDFIGIDEPLTHPRFAFHKRAATYTATNSASGADVAWLGDGETWSQWTAGSASVTVTMTFSGTRAIDYVGIAAHDFDLAGSTINLQIDTGSGFATVAGLGSVQPTDGSDILFLISPVNADAVRIVVTGSSAPSMAVFQAGKVMELPRLTTYTALPISESEQTSYRTARSIRGQILSAVIESAELNFSIDIQHLSETWRRASGVASWGAFIDHVRTVGPFFVASRPSAYPEDVAYGRATERPRFNRAIPNANVAGEFTVQFQGYKRP